MDENDFCHGGTVVDDAPDLSVTAPIETSEAVPMDYMNTYFCKSSFKLMPAIMPPSMSQLPPHIFQQMYQPSFVGGVPMTSLCNQPGIVCGLSRKESDGVSTGMVRRGGDKSKRNPGTCNLWCKRSDCSRGAVTTRREKRTTTSLQ